MKSAKDRAVLTMGMRLSLLVGVLMLVMKVGAYLITGSAAILSDAAESVVHIVAVGFAFYSLRLSYKPADDDHHYGHEKIAFFSAGFEGSMIVIAAVYIIFEAVWKWFGGLQLDNLGLGTAITAIAATINAGLGTYLLRLGKSKRSLVLEANGKHVLTDCWTSVGVLIGLGLAITTGWQPWDPIFAILVALNILYSGIGLIRTSLGGLMDRAIPEVQTQLVEILDRETRSRNIVYHDLRHRSLGDFHSVELHLLFPKDTSVQDAHRTATAIERIIEASLEPGARVTTHLEAIEDHADVHEDEDVRR
jgi:cation diffusion facilitator family transporter